MSDLSYKMIGDVQPGDEVVGLTTDTQGGDIRKKTVRTKVKGVHRYRGPLVRIALSSGKTIRCTPDHKWYIGKAGRQRWIYKQKWH